jgi:hypothetical protein
VNCIASDEFGTTWLDWVVVRPWKQTSITLVTVYQWEVADIRHWQVLQAQDVLRLGGDLHSLQLLVSALQKGSLAPARRVTLFVHDHYLAWPEMIKLCKPLADVKTDADWSLELKQGYGCHDVSPDMLHELFSLLPALDSVALGTRAPQGRPVGLRALATP